MKKDFLFGNSGKALLEKYQYNPYRICRSGKKRFSATMKKAVPRIKNTTLEKIFCQACSAAKNRLDHRYIELIELQLTQCWQDLDRSLNRKQQAKTAMEALYCEALGDDPRLPRAQKGVITTFHLARIVAETGPLSDFDNWRKLLRFSGYNLCDARAANIEVKPKSVKRADRFYVKY